MIHIEGDTHEGGGQILRTSLALSARTGTPFRMDKIRLTRKQPGLKAQHLTGVRLAQQLCDARVEGAEIGSTSLTFVPGALKAGEFAVDVGTAGSVTLLLQSCYWALAAGPGKSTVSLTGGTDVIWSPPFDYVREVTGPLYGEMAGFRTLSLTRGFHPRGGGRWLFEVEPGKHPVDLAFGVPGLPGQVRGRAVASEVLRERRVAERMKERVQKHLKARIEVEYCPSPSPGAVLTLWTECEPPRAASCVGERGKTAEQVADEAVELLKPILERPEPIEAHLADQLVPFLALVGGELLCQEITPHTLANIYVCDQFLGPRLRVKDKRIERI